MNYDHNNLKAYRKKHGLTQEQLAETLGVTRQTVAKWENGDTVPDIENIIALADLYEVSIDSLVRNLAQLPPDAANKKHMFGVTRLDDQNRITLPEKCCEVFSIKQGDTLLILGDEERGIAVMKISEV